MTLENPKTNALLLCPLNWAEGGQVKSEPRPSALQRELCTEWQRFEVSNKWMPGQWPRVYLGGGLHSRGAGPWACVPAEGNEGKQCVSRDTETAGTEGPVNSSGRGVASREGAPLSVLHDEGLPG